MAGALREMIRALLRGERETEGEGVIRTATGQEKRVAMRWSLHGASHSTMLVSLVDITERKRVEEQLQRAREHAEEASRAKSDFLASMSHELRTPLNGVIGMTGFLLDTALSDEQRQYASTVRASADTLLGLVNNILDLSKIEAGMMDLEPVPFELSVLLEEVALLVGTTAHAGGVELVTRQAPGTPRFVRGDAGRIRQVLTNLAANALKFTSRGHVLMQLECLARASGEAVIRFSVEDTGIGIPAGKLESIFEKFTQADASTTRRYGGSGLGLTICKRLVELMGGTIAVRSQVGAGSTFSFTLRLPVVEGEDQPLPAALSGARALVVGRQRGEPPGARGAAARLGPPPRHRAQRGRGARPAPRRPARGEPVPVCDRRRAPARHRRVRARKGAPGNGGARRDARGPAPLGRPGPRRSDPRRERDRGGGRQAGEDARTCSSRSAAGLRGGAPPKRPALGPRAALRERSGARSSRRTTG